MSLKEQKRRGASQRQSIVGHLVDVYRTQPDKRPLYWGAGIGTGMLVTSLACLSNTLPVTQVPTSFPITPLGPTVTETPVPPTPTEAAPVLQLDKPMTIEYDPFKLDVMPTITENDSELLPNTVDAKWKTDGTYDTQGNVVLPPGVQPVQPGQWKIDKGNEIYLNWQHPDNLDPKNAPFQKSNELFATKNKDGVIDGFLITEKLYYYDNQGILRVTPVFFRVESNQLFSTTLPDGRKTTDDVRRAAVFMDYGHNIIGEYIGNVYSAIAQPVIGKDQAYRGNNGLVDYANLFAPGPMQDLRSNIISSVESGNFDPKDLSKVWVAGQSTQLVSQIVNLK